MLLTTQNIDLKISKELRRKIDIACSFAGAKYKLRNGYVSHIKETNIGFVTPHILEVNNNVFLIFDNSRFIYVNGFNKKILFNDLTKYIKNN